MQVLNLIQFQKELWPHCGTGLAILSLLTFFRKSFRATIIQQQKKLLDIFFEKPTCISQMLQQLKIIPHFEQKKSQAFETVYLITYDGFSLFLQLSTCN